MSFHEVLSDTKAPLLYQVNRVLESRDIETLNQLSNLLLSSSTIKILFNSDTSNNWRNFDKFSINKYQIRVLKKSQAFNPVSKFLVDHDI